MADVENSYPQIKLTNGQTDLTICLPDAERGFYRGVRFDWSGLILRATCKGHTWFGEWKPTLHDPEGNDDSAGPCGEFGMGVDGMPPPLGYEDAKVGEAFLKIGVGQLRKTEEKNYRFGYNYDLLTPAPWKVRRGTSWIKFSQQAKDCTGNGYHFTKRVVLEKKRNEFTIEYTLRNLGTRALHQAHYSHDFVILDDQPIGPDYHVVFPFAPVATRNLKGIATIAGNELHFLRPVAEKEALYSELKGFDISEKSHDGVLIRNAKTGAGLRIQGDTPVIRFHLFATAKAVCPEPFIDIRLAPGKEMKWAHRYTLLLPKER